MNGADGNVWVGGCQIKRSFLPYFLLTRLPCNPFTRELNWQARVCWRGLQLAHTQPCAGLMLSTVLVLHQSSGKGRAHFQTLNSTGLASRWSISPADFTFWDLLRTAAELHVERVTLAFIQHHLLLLPTENSKLLPPRWNFSIKQV